MGRSTGAVRKEKGVRRVKGAVIEKMSALITAAFGLVAALAWNDAIKAIFKAVFGTSEGIGPMLTYAVTVTLIAVFVTLWIGKVSARAVK
jgi:hypothetical protein